MANEDDELDKNALMNQLDVKSDFPTRADNPAEVATKMPVIDKPDAPAAGSVAPMIQPQIFQGFTPAQAMEGFDWNREQNTGKSAKDAFAFLANEAAHGGHAAPINDKTALQAWANQYIVPGMNQLGHNISNVEGDKFHLKNWQGDFDVDYGRGAGAENGALAWQVQEPTAVLSNKGYTPQAAAAQNPALANAIAGGGEGSNVSDETKKQIEALIAGGTPPMDEKALLEQLQV